MGLFRKKTVRVLRKGGATEERSVSTVGGETVTVRRFKEDKAEPAEKKPKKNVLRRPPSPATANARLGPPIVVRAGTALTSKSFPHRTRLANRCW